MSNYRQIVLEDSPVSYWRLGETSGATAADEMGLNGGAYSGTVTLGTPGALFDEYNFAAMFDGISGVMAVPHSASLVFTDAMTVEAWISMGTSPPFDPEIIVGKRSTAQPDWGLFYGFASDLQCKAQFEVSDGFSPIRTAFSRLLQINTWNHVVGVYTGSLLRLYIDGVEQGVPTAHSTTLINSALPLDLANDPVNVVFSNCSVDEVAVYNYALTPERIMAHYAAGVGAGLNALEHVAEDFPAARGRG